MKIWRLKKGADKRLRQGHPWVFSGELAHSTKEAIAGDVVEMRDAQDHFLAYGYVHPSSAIAFRKLTANSKEQDVLSTSFFRKRFKQAREHRVQAGWAKQSHRWLFAEGDGVPGLIADAFLLASGGWVVVVQASTVGMDRALPQIFEALKDYESELAPLTIVEASSSRSRLAEGLPIGAKKVISGSATLENAKIVLREGLELSCDLLNGQKTGFFLDQQQNAEILRRFVQAQFAGAKETVRVLDICCYVGQWGSHVAHALHQAGVKAEITLLDSSVPALDLASANVLSLGAQAKPVLGDVMKVLSDFTEPFDIVICDPPAFVKKKTDLEQGLKAYAKINALSMKLVKPGGLLVASSCSGLVRSADWWNVLKESSVKAGRTFKQLASLGHAPDHPVRPDFPEGEYLKCVIGRIEFPY